MRRFIFGMAIAAAAGLSPVWAVAADQEIAQRIAATLRESGRLSDYSLGVQYEDGTVWLSGRVASQEQMAVAVSMARELADVTDVVNRLEVRSSQSSEEQGNPYPLASEADASQTAERADAYEGSVRSTTRSALGSRGFAAAPRQQVSYDAQQTQAIEPSSRPSQPVPMMSDPGDPLSQKQEARFAPSSSRRLSSDPVIRTPGSRSAAGTSANRKASYNVPQQGGYAGEGYDQSQGQPSSRPVAAQPAGFRHHQPPMAAGCPGGCNGGMGMGGMGMGGPAAMGGAGMVGGGAAYDNAYMPNYAWPSYASYPNYAAVTYPTQYSAAAWPYIGPFYPYPQVPLGWRKVSLEWDDGWWFLSFHDRHHHH